MNEPSAMQEKLVPARRFAASFDAASRLRAAAIHLAISAVIAALAAGLVFMLWYPTPYRQISGGSDLFRLLVAVDVVLGPLITFAIFNRAKPRTELRRDLAVVGLLQLAGLAYGLYTVQLARPVHMVFEYDRFRVVHQVDIPEELLSGVPAGIDYAPLSGPTVLALRPFRNDQEKTDYTLEALKGVQLSARPDLWQPYEAARPQVLAAARPLAELKKRFPGRGAEIDQAVRESGADPARIAWLPVVARKAQAWTVLLDADARVVGYVAIDSF